MNFSFRGMVRRAEEKQSLYEAQSYVPAPLLNQQEQEKEGKMVVMVAKKAAVTRHALWVTHPLSLPLWFARSIHIVSLPCLYILINMDLLLYVYP